MKSTTPAAVKEILTPALNYNSTPNLRFEAQIDCSGCVIVSGRNLANQRDLGFALTAKAIEDGLWPAQFKAALPKLRELLLQEGPVADVE